MRTGNGALASAFAFFALAAAASAQEFCVTCTGPEATYRCVIGGDNLATRSTRGQLLCITELAKSGHHASCSAGRLSEGTCPGELRTVVFPGEAEPMAPVPAEAPPPAIPGPYAKQPVEAKGPAGAPPPATPPANLPPGEAAPAETPPPEAPSNAVEDGLKKAGKAVSDTGDAVGHAVKKTWNCVTSFFGNC